MMLDRIKNPKYIDIVIAVVISYVLIKIIDNYPFFINIIEWIFSILRPFIAAFICAYILNPIMKLCEKRFNLTRVVAILVTYILILGAIIISGIYFMPRMVSSLLDIVKSTPEFADKAQIWLSDLFSDERLQVLMNSSFGQELSPSIIIEKASTVLLSLVDGTLSTIFSITNSLIKWVFGFILSIYILYDKEKFIDTGKKFIYLIFRKKYGDATINLIGNMHSMIGVYVGTKALDSLIIGLMAWVGLSILDSEYTLLISTIVGVTNMIPYFGPFVGMLIAFLINVFFSPFEAFIILIFLFLLQQFDAWYLDPKLIGNKVGVSPFLIILAVTVGGAIYGPIGMILAVPSVAVIQTYFEKMMNKFMPKLDAKSESKI